MVKFWYVYFMRRYCTIKIKCGENDIDYIHSIGLERQYTIINILPLDYFFGGLQIKHVVVHVERVGIFEGRHYDFRFDFG